MQFWPKADGCCCDEEPAYPTTCVDLRADAPTLYLTDANGTHAMTYYPVGIPETGDEPGWRCCYLLSHDRTFVPSGVGCSAPPFGVAPGPGTTGVGYVLNCVTDGGINDGRYQLLLACYSRTCTSSADGGSYLSRSVACSADALIQTLSAAVPINLQGRLETSVSYGPFTASYNASVFAPGFVPISSAVVISETP